MVKNIPQGREKEKASRYIAVVRQWADQLLDMYNERFAAQYAPLFPDGIHVQTLEPLVWMSNGETWVLSNLASQQNWFRTLYGLSKLTKVQRYADVAREATAYALKKVRYGYLMAWGGHMAYDLAAKKWVHAADKGPQHELKFHFPFYELMFELDPDETLTMIEAMWDSHVANWMNLEFNRHGQPKPGPAGGYGAGKVWERPFKREPVFFTGRGLTFVNAGSDLYYAAALAGAYSGQEAPLRWAEYLAGRYAETAHPETGLTGYQYSISELPGQRGDRAREQFGEQLAEDQPLEATLSVARKIHSIVGKAALCRMAIYDQLGERGRTFLDWALKDQLAYGRHAYEAAENVFHPVLTNGRRLTGLILEKDGYYGRRGQALQAMPANDLLFWSYASGYRRSQHPELWRIVCSMARGLGLADFTAVAHLPKHPRTVGAEAHKIDSADPHLLFGLLELAAAHPAGPFLDWAIKIGENIVATRLHDGFFLPTREQPYAKLDAVEPLALLHLAAALRGERDQVPRYCGGSAFFSAHYDGKGHYKDQAFYYLAHR